MILPVHDALRAHVARLLTTLYSLDAGASPAIVLEYPPNRDLGDLELEVVGLEQVIHGVVPFLGWAAQPIRSGIASAVPGPGFRSM